MVTGVRVLKRVPIRTCIACRKAGDKRALVRFVRMAEGTVVLDPTGKKAGRGAYVCPDPGCLSKALAGPLEKALKISVDPETKERLRAEFAEQITSN